MRDKWNDADIFGEIDTDLLTREINVAYGSRNDHPIDKWVNNPVSLEVFIDSMSRHKEGAKDGPCFLQSELIGGARRGPAVKALHLLGVDLDTGEDPEEVLTRVHDKGLFCIAYSTHSHMKASTEIEKSTLVTFYGGGREPTLDDAVAYLLTKKRYRPHILEGAEMMPPQHTSRGVLVKIKHKPMPKFRLVFVLDKPFVIAERHPDPKRSIVEWKNRYAGVSIALGVHFDKTCVDPTRLFYSPRHPKDGPFFINVLAGKALHIEDYAEITAEDLRKMDLDAFAAEEDSLAKAYRTERLGKFAAKYSSRFRVRDFLNDRGIKSLGTANGGETFNPCPFEGDHSNVGDEEDSGFWVLDGDGDKGFSITCKHNGCVGRDRLDFLDGLCCVGEPITDAKALLEWVDQEVGDPEDMGWDDPIPGTEHAKHIDLVKSVGGYTTLDQAKRAIASCPNTDQAITALMHGIGCGAFSDLTRASLVSDVAKLLDRPKPILRKMAEAALREKLVASRTAIAPTSEDEKELAEFNEKFAVVRLNNSTRIMVMPCPGEMPNFLGVMDFQTWVANKVTVVMDPKTGAQKIVPLSQQWLQWDKRLSYNQVVFEPSLLQEECAAKGIYNVWHGFPVKGDGDPNEGWGMLHDHIFFNICQSNQDHYVWLMTWIAQIFQQPGEKMGSAVAIRGKKGAGKSTLFYWVAKALGRHAIKVSQREHITGKFNAHTTNVLLMICEEAFWAGDQAAGNVLKDLISSDQSMVERKGMDSVQMSNYTRLALISNEDWIVPAGLEDERRYFVLECGSEKQNDATYFEAIRTQMENGGVAAMVKFFEEWEPTDYTIECYGEKEPMIWAKLRKPPRTKWLTEQGVQSMQTPDRFFMQAAMFGYIGSASRDGVITPTSLHDTEHTHISLEDLSYHYNEALKQGFGSRNYANNREHMLKLAQKWLLASPLLVLEKGAEGYEQNVVLGTWNDIKAVLATQGIMHQDYLRVLNLATMAVEADVTVSTHTRDPFATEAKS